MSGSPTACRAPNISFNLATSGDTPEVGKRSVRTFANFGFASGVDETLDFALLIGALSNSAWPFYKKLPPAAEFKESLIINIKAL
ncbi:hypothetical protein Tco_1396580 [Tanacetum coccineum]